MNESNTSEKKLTLLDLREADPQLLLKDGEPTVLSPDHCHLHGKQRYTLNSLLVVDL